METDGYAPPGDWDALYAAISAQPPLAVIDAAVPGSAVEAARRAWANTMALNNHGSPAARFYYMTGIIAAFRDALFAAKPLLTDEAAELRAEKVHPKDLVAAMERGGWIRRGGRAGSHVRMSWPPAVSNQGVSILIPLNPEAADYDDLLQAVLAELTSAANRGRAAGEVLSAIGFDPGPDVGAECGKAAPLRAGDLSE